VASCLFVSDLHGSVPRWRSLLDAIGEFRPRAVFLGGDLFPNGLAAWRGERGAGGDFLADFLLPELEALRGALGSDWPALFLVLGNDDPRSLEEDVLDAEARGVWRYAHGRRLDLDGVPVFGYAYVPPTPFLGKDWERYDVSRYVPPGAVSPEEGRRSVPVAPDAVRYGTIWQDLQALAGDADLERAIFLFHAPPFETRLDRAALDGKMVDHVPLDLHVGSIAVRRFIETRQPAITLHGHVHESARLTGSWRDRIGRTWLFSGAHDGPELALVRFDPGDPEGATRVLL